VGRRADPRLGPLDRRAGRVGDLIAPLIGAEPGEVLVSDSTTVNFYKLAVAALDGAAGPADRRHGPRQLPTDRYVLEGLAGRRGLEIAWIEPDPVDGPTLDDVAAARRRTRATSPS
jgi:kynureninase